MKIIVVASTKGGVGKSTIAFNLASMDKKIVLADADNQQSSLLLAKSREELGLSPISAISLESEKDLLMAKEDYHDYQFMVIDCGGRDTEMFRLSLIYADAIIVPVQGGQFDLWGTTDTLDLIQEAFRAKGSTVPVICVLNQARKNTNLFKDIISSLETISEEYNVTLSSSVLSQREDYRRSLTIGKGVCEYKPSSLASQEIQSLYKEIKKL